MKEEKRFFFIFEGVVIFFIFKVSLFFGELEFDFFLFLFLIFLCCLVLVFFF